MSGASSVAMGRVHVPGSNRTFQEAREWVAQRVESLEGLRDDVLIDMVMRRLEDPGYDRAGFEASLGILMSGRALEFAAALWHFLGRTDASAAAATSTAQGTRGAAAKCATLQASDIAVEQGSLVDNGSGVGLESEASYDDGDAGYSSGEYDQGPDGDEGEEDSFDDESEQEYEAGDVSDACAPCHRLPRQEDGHAPAPAPSLPPPVAPNASQAGGNGGERNGGDGARQQVAAAWPLPPSVPASVDLVPRLPTQQPVEDSTLSSGGKMALPDEAVSPVSTIDPYEIVTARLASNSLPELDVASATSCTSIPTMALDRDACHGCLSLSASCAVACDGIEQAYLPTPLSDPPMDDGELDQLRDWLTEAAQQLYGDDASEHADLVDRTAAVLRNSMLTSTVFAAFVAEEADRAGAVESTSTRHVSPATATKESASAAKRLDLSALPSSLRSLLDSYSLEFLRELWHVLQRDEPTTAQALLQPEHNDSVAVSRAHASGTEPLSTSRCDVVGEALFATLGGHPKLLPPPISSSGVVGWDARVIKAWVQKRVTLTQGFADQVVIDTILRWLAPLTSFTESSTACVTTPLCSGAAAVQPMPVKVEEQLDGLKDSLKLLIQDAAVDLVASLVEFLNTDEARGGLEDALAEMRSSEIAGSRGMGVASPHVGPADAKSPRIPAQVEAWCQAEYGAHRVLLLAEVSEGVLVVMQASNRQGCALLQRPGTRGLSPLSSVPPSSLRPLHGAWASKGGAVVQVGSTLYHLRTQEPLAELARLPKGASGVDVSCCERSGALTVVAIADASTPAPQFHRPVVTATLPSMTVYTAKVTSSGSGPPVTRHRQLWRFSYAQSNQHRQGWVEMGSVGDGACRLSISNDGRRLAWCEADISTQLSCRPSASACCWPPYESTSADGSNDDSWHAYPPGDDTGFGPALLRGEFFVAELVSPLEPRAITQDAGHCGKIAIAPDGTGLAYVATHRTEGVGCMSVRSTSSGDATAPSLWWQVWEGGVPPVQMCIGSLSGQVIGFGWAPPAEDEEHVYENDKGEEETEVLSGLRLWVTTLREDCSPCTQLIDLQGAILGAFELPIAGDAIVWLRDGRRVLITESLEWFPALWDGASLAPLPLKQGLSQLRVTKVPWPAKDGGPMAAFSYSLHGLAPDAPLLIHLHDARDVTPMMGNRLSAATAQRSLLPLLKLGYRVVRVCCVARRRSASFSSAATADPEALVEDVVSGLDHFLASRSTEQRAKVGLLGEGLGGLLAWHALACFQDRFSTAVIQGAPVSESWQAMETGFFTPPRADVSSAGAVEHELLCRLARTQIPVLLLYGEADPYCPISHAQAAFNALQKSSSETELVIYAQDDHWLRRTSHHADANVCVCKWMLRHMPITAA